MDLQPEKLLEMHRQMVCIRLFEETAGKLMEKGQMPDRKSTRLNSSHRT